MIVLIDNFDSFAHNLARYFEQLGQTVQLVRNNAIDVSSARSLRPDAIVLSPGPCTPTEAGASLSIARELHAEVPMLGVCLGHQVLCEALGGRIIRAPRPVHGQASLIRHTGSTLFQGIPSPLTVGRYHSLIADAVSMPSDLQATAWGDEVIMAFQHKHYPVFGVQFHPESILTKNGYDLLANFLHAAGIPTLANVRSLALSEAPRRQDRAYNIPNKPITF